MIPLLTVWWCTVVLLVLIVVGVTAYRHARTTGLLLLLLLVCIAVAATPPSTVSQLQTHLSLSPSSSTGGIKDGDRMNDSVRGYRGDWRRCIIEMGNHMELEGGKTGWIDHPPNPCGFESRTTPLSMQVMLFPDANTNTNTADRGSSLSVVFLGDSLSMHTFSYEVGKYYPPYQVPRPPKAVRKVVQFPNRWSYSTIMASNGVGGINSTSPSQQRPQRPPVYHRSNVAFRKALHIQEGVGCVEEEIAAGCVVVKKDDGVGGGDNLLPTVTPNIIFMTFGNWDRNYCAV